MSTLTATPTLLRLILRRDRFVLPAWILLLAAVVLAYGSSFTTLYPTAQSREAYAAGITGNAGELALIGPVFGSTVGALTAWRSGAILFLLALASTLTVIRHTRAEEETGRRELLGSAVVGQHASLFAALIAAVGASLMTGTLITLGLLSLGLGPSGSLALGASMAAAGVMFAGVAGVAAQLTDGARAARGISVAVLALAFLLRAAGDASGNGHGFSWLSWASPIGWLQQVRPFAGERWWLFAGAAGLAIVLTAGAFALSSRRDLGGGVMPARLGPSTAPPRLSTPVALAWRLHRPTLLAWSIGFLVIGTVVGGTAKGVGDQLGASSQLQDVFTRIGGGGIVDAYLTALIGILGLLASAYAIAATLRLRTEETAARAEPLLATAVSRVRWLTSHLIFAVLGSAVLLALAGLSAGLSYGLATHNLGEQLPRMLGAALVQLPAVWLLTGVTVALFGFVPRLVTAASWVILGVFLLLGQIGELLHLSQFVLDLSPFTHTPKLPGAPMSVTPVLWLLAIAILVGMVGLLGFRRRGIN